MFPQLWQLWRTRSADDLSHVFLAFYNIGAVATWPAAAVSTMLLHSCWAGRPTAASTAITHVVDMRCGREGDRLTHAFHLPCPAAAGMLLLVFYNLFMELWVFVVACILQLGEHMRSAPLARLRCSAPLCSDLHTASPAALLLAAAFVISSLPAAAWLAYNTQTTVPCVLCSSRRAAPRRQGVGRPLAAYRAQAAARQVCARAKGCRLRCSVLRQAHAHEMRARRVKHNRQ